MIATHPDRFYPQTWHEGEAFMDTEPRTDLQRPNLHVGTGATEYTAADLAALWLADPSAGIWSFYLWTNDTDEHGQRVYVGQNGKGLEIHRHLHLTSRWVVPSRWVVV